MNISDEQQIDYFLTKYSYDLLIFFDELKNKYPDILNNCNNKAPSNFIDLIMNNIDLKNLYLQNFKS